MEKSCANCRYWHGEQDDIGCKECRRYPPSVPIVDYVTAEGVEVHLKTRGGDVVYVTWPRTDCEDWCGEWSPDDEMRAEMMGGEYLG